MRVSLLLFILLPWAGFTQNHTISGTVTDATTGEALIGANVFVTSTKTGTTTNSYGFYSLTIPSADSLGVAFTYVGYTAQFKKVYLDQNIELSVELAPGVGLLDEVVVSGVRSDENVARPQMGVVDIPTEKIKELPAILGEVDVLKVVQLLPGVQSGNEGTTGFFVRGGNADQNLVQLDEAIVYNPNHLFGLFSTFNTRAINNVRLIKGGFPAQYGGRLSSILDISMKEGNNKRLGVEGGIGLVTSQLTAEGPIKKEKASFIVSGRRTYFDWMIKPFLTSRIRTSYSFYDLNAKVNWQIGPKDRLFLSAFNGKDDATYIEDGIEYNVRFGNTTGTLRWNHIFGQKLFLNTSFIINEYDQNISALQDNSFSEVLSGINDVNGKLEFQYYPNPDHIILFGAHYLDHTFRSSGRTEAQSGSDPSPGIDANTIPVKYFDEFALYVNDEMKLSERLSANLGLRLPGFFSDEASYYRIEPRASLKVALGPASSVKAAYTMMNQFLHLVPSSTASVPTEIWVPSTEKTRPQLSTQYSVGYFQNFRDNEYESSLEVYYKDMRNQVLFREGNQLIESLDIDSLLTYGKGWSYGAELFLRKNRGKLTGWISYTLSWTNQRFEELNFGNTFPFRYDRRHNLSVVGTYELGKRWSLSATFVFSSGNVYTVPVGRVGVFYGGSLFEGNYFVYEERNNVRMNPYHRLDLSASHKREWKLLGKPLTSEWVFSVYNTYSRLNPYFVFFEVEPATGEPKAKQVSLLPIIPSITYNFKF
ncbi:MAG: TonB-dependent receptor [Phaeodactylibacter sp.]|nr:TonB-dependent receptor [Phaeodactylibacter sp.]MCB9265596.1 TonB-dependent receptor [Lewinellaceae bacterium]MCB9290033.1 TonB-dependent receptor [Lewinellaceae bacterium]